MPDKKMFAISVPGREKIPVTRVIFPNGCTFYKLVQNEPIWLINAGDKWKATATDMPDRSVITAIISLLKTVPGAMPDGQQM